MPTDYRNGAQIEALLSRLNKVKATSSNSYQACCPAHEDKSPSLSIKIADDRILLKCWSGCNAQDIVSALGLSMRDLFLKSDSLDIERYRQAKREEQRNKDKLTLHIAKGALQRGEKLSIKDKDYLSNALKRLYSNSGSAKDE